MIQLLRYMLFPFAVLYGIVVRVRHLAYDKRVLKSVQFEIPTICVGNVSVGGTGKTPMVEYLIRNLQENYKIGVVSRGYKRKTKGLVMADTTSTVYDLGDEPFQFWKKYPKISLVVNADRASGISHLLALPQPPEVILLDDAFQHRKVEAKINVVLTAYGNLFTDDWLLPTGNLRDVVSRVQQADVIVVTKCPPHISQQERKKIATQIRQKEHQSVVFATIAYGEKVISANQSVYLEEFIKLPFLLVTGIANPVPLLNFLNKCGATFEHLNFADHHHFSETEIEKLKQSPRVLTTEKDYVRLESRLSDIFYLPIETVFIDKTEEATFWKILDLQRKS